MVEDWELPPKIWNETGYSLLPLLFNIVVEVLDKAVRQEKISILKEKKLTVSN